MIIHSNSSLRSFASDFVLASLMLLAALTADSMGVCPVDWQEEVRSAPRCDLRFALVIWCAPVALDEVQLNHSRLTERCTARFARRSLQFDFKVQLVASPTPVPNTPPPSTNSCWERALFLECTSESFNYANANDMAYINSDGDTIVNRLVPVVPNNYDLQQFQEAR